MTAAGIDYRLDGIYKQRQAGFFMQRVSCQLADVGVAASTQIADAYGGKRPRFDLYRRKNSRLGEKINESLTEVELIEVLRQIN